MRRLLEMHSRVMNKSLENGQLTDRIDFKKNEKKTVWMYKKII